MQFQVPQFIETEDKIVGPLTLKQFFWVGGAGAVSILLFFTVQTWLWFLLSLVVVGGGIAFAFVKINGRPLVGAALAAVRFWWMPQTYVWQPEAPHIKKEEALRSAGVGEMIQNIISGLTLKRTFEKLQTKKPEPKERRGEVGMEYEIVRQLSGKREVARRVDYR